MTPAPISVERLRELLAVMTGSDPNRMTDFPGGCDCHECGCIFIGGDGHDYCAQCESKRQLLAALPEALPALLHQLAEREAEVERLRRECDLRKHAIDRWVPCPDHRDKVDRRCQVCAKEAAERAREGATGLLRRVNASLYLLDKPHREFGGVTDKTATDIAAFLAARGRKDNV